MERLLWYGAGWVDRGTYWVRGRGRGALRRAALPGRKKHEGGVDAGRPVAVPWASPVGDDGRVVLFRRCSVQEPDKPRSGGCYAALPAVRPAQAGPTWPRGRWPFGFVHDKLLLRDKRLRLDHRAGPLSSPFSAETPGRFAGTGENGVRSHGGPCRPCDWARLRDRGG